MALLEHQHVKKAYLIDDSLWPKILRPKMNCTVRFGKQFSESSPCLPGQQGTGQQGWYASGTLRKQFTKPTVEFILGPSRHLSSGGAQCRHHCSAEDHHHDAGRHRPPRTARVAVVAAPLRRPDGRRAQAGGAALSVAQPEIGSHAVKILTVWLNNIAEELQCSS